MNEQPVRDIITKRAGAIAARLRPLFENRTTRMFYIAGGSLSRCIADVDIFPVGDDAFADVIKECKVVFQSRNATTIEFDPWPVQFCTYKRASLAELIASFDFAHIQIGATIQADGKYLTVQEVTWTEAYVQAHAAQTTWFTGSQYPLSSLLRAEKYFRKGVLTRGAYVRAILETLPEIIERGFANWDDFKDQLDAVDLGLLPEELAECESASIRKLFKQLCKGNS